MSDIETDDGNIIVNLKKLKALLDPHLAYYDVCKTSKFVLHRINISNLCQKLRLTCPSCKAKTLTIKESMRYLNHTIPELHSSPRKK